MNYYAFVSLFNGVVVLCIGLYLFSRQRQNSLYQSFAVFSAFVGLWCIFYAFWQIQTNGANALMYMRLAMLTVYPVPFAFLWFVMNLTGWKRRRWYPLAIFSLSLFFMLWGFSPLMVKDVAPKLNFPFWPQPGLFMHAYVLIFFSTLVACYGILWRAYYCTEGIQKWQIKWVALAMLPGWLGGATNWLLWYGVPVPPVPHFFIGVAFLILSYAIVRSRLFDVDAITDLVQEAKLSALGIMATSINHEVRNPLYVIRGLAEGHLEKIESHAYEGQAQLIARSTEVLRKTIQQADRALEIILNFSSYAKRQSSRAFDKQPLDIKEVLDSILPLVCGELVLDRIQLRMHILSKTMVCADRHSLEEIFINLIVNACQAMKDGGEISLSAKKDDPWTVITVQDTGPGLSSDQLLRIFEPFYTTKATGTGLGLYVVKQLVEKNRGKVDVSSKEGIGTIFTLLFPQPQ